MKDFFKFLIEKIKNAESDSRIRFAIIFSIIIHLLFLSTHWSFDKKNTPKPQQVQLTVSSEHAKQIEKIRQMRKKHAAQVKRTVKKQIVNNELSGRKEKPDSNRFLGEKDQMFDRQTIANKIGIFNKAGKGSKTGDKMAKADDPDKKGEGQKGKSSKGTKRKFSLGDLAIGNTKDFKEFKKGSGKGNNSLSAAKLGLKRGDIKSSGLAKNNDFIEDVPLGDFTNLNTQEFKYYGFYHRIRQKLEQFWGNSLREKAERLYKSGRRMPASTNLITSLKITIDGKGNIVDVYVMGSSGVRELDDAAIESFNKAGPFPNPPKGMLINGKAVIEWGFVVKS